MKMVSQLTRQALHRHRLIAACPSAAASPASAAGSRSDPAEPTEFQMLHPLYAAAPSPKVPAAPPPPRPRTVYQQLMTSHDRMNERHLRRS